MKLCSKCKIEKPLGEFGPHKLSPDGYTYICKKCRTVYRKQNRSSINAYNRKYEKDKKRTDINFRLKTRLRSRISDLVRNKSASAVKDLGCSMEQFKLYIEAQFQPGMTWKNYGQWHLDHVIPLSKFNLEDKTEFLEACNYLNIQPLWAEDNLKKGNKNGVEVGKPRKKPT